MRYKLKTSYLTISYFHISDTFTVIIFNLLTPQNLTVEGSQENIVCVEGKIFVFGISSFRAVVGLHLELIFCSHSIKIVLYLE